MDSFLIFKFLRKFKYRGYYDLSNWIIRYSWVVFIEITDRRKRVITWKEAKEEWLLVGSPLQFFHSSNNNLDGFINLFDSGHPSDTEPYGSFGPVHGNIHGLQNMGNFHGI